MLALRENKFNSYRMNMCITNIYIHTYESSLYLKLCSIHIYSRTRHSYATRATNFGRFNWRQAATAAFAAAGNTFSVLLLLLSPLRAVLTRTQMAQFHSWWIWSWSWHKGYSMAKCVLWMEWARLWCTLNHSITNLYAFQFYSLLLLFINAFTIWVIHSLCILAKSKTNNK